MMWSENLIGLVGRDRLTDGAQQHGSGKTDLQQDSPLSLVCVAVSGDDACLFAAGRRGFPNNAKAAADPGVCRIRRRSA